jgi:nucleoside-diphosphate-sugar epimerase
VIEALRAAGRPVRALVRPAAVPVVTALGAEPVVGDVTDAGTWERARAGGLAGIVHAAAIVQRPRTSYARYVAVNVEGTRLAIAAARATHARLVHLSSVAVYGGSSAYTPRPEQRTEDFPFGPIAEHDYYARTKREAEELVRAAAREGRGELSAVALRPNVIYGERDRLFTPRLLRALRGRIVPLIGSGANRLSTVYAGNVASAVLRALDAAGPGFRAYNITTDAPPLVSFREFLETFAAAAEIRVRFVRIPLPLARLVIGVWSGRALARAALSFVTGENPYVADRARTELGWSPRFSAREAIRRTLARKEEGNEKPG